MLRFSCKSRNAKLSNKRSQRKSEERLKKRERRGKRKKKKPGLKRQQRLRQAQVEKVKLDSKVQMLQMKWVLKERMENRTHRLHKLQRRKPTFKMVNYYRREQQISLAALILNPQLMQMMERTRKRKLYILKESLLMQKTKLLLLKTILMKSVMMTMMTVKSLQRRIEYL